jgi:hypothetical protein
MTNSTASAPAYPGKVPGVCILSIPEDATVTRMFNSTNAGSVFTFQNGTRYYFDDAKCPQPVKAQLYSIIYPIMTDPRCRVSEIMSHIVDRVNVTR